MLEFEIQEYQDQQTAESYPSFGEKREPSWHKIQLLAHSTLVKQKEEIESKWVSVLGEVLLFFNGGQMEEDYNVFLLISHALDIIVTTECNDRY